MSLRKAKLLLEQKKKITQLQNNEQQEQEQAEQSVQVKPKNSVNMFSAFGNQSQSEKQQIQEEEKKQVEEQKKKKKKKNKKKKKKGNENKNEQEEQEEDIDKILLEAGFEVKKDNQNKEEDTDYWETILRINQNKFNYEKELRRHFSGWHEEKNDDPDLNKKEQKFQKHLKKMMKKSILSPGVKEFFPIREKFEVERDQDRIRFIPTKKYDHFQVEYEAIRNSNDINALFHFTQLHPQHVDSLYAVGQFLRLQGNYRDADTLIQRVIYIYEFAASYDLGQFIKYDILKKFVVYDMYSTSLFMSLFKMMDILGKKGCFKAALEYNKFLLKINLDDPTACLLSIDFNAISSKNYVFLLEFIRGFGRLVSENKQSLYLMPNFIYSAALAQFHIYNQSKQSKQDLVIQETNLKTLLQFTDQDWKQALKLPLQNNFDKEDPKTLILRAILAYPRLILQIANKNEFSKQFLNNPVFVGNQKKTFKEILKHQFWEMVPESYSYHFLKLENQKDSNGLDKVLDVYVQRSKILWKSNEVMLWVKAAMGYILNKIDEKQFSYQEHLQGLCVEESGGLPIPFYLRRYENISKANFSDRVEQVDLANIQDNQRPQQQQQGNRMNLEGNPISLFLQSLMPWNNLPNAGQEFDPDMPNIEEDD